MRNKAVLYWETLRHLKAVQFYGRAWFRLVTPRPDLAPAPATRACSGLWTVSAQRNIKLIDKSEFQFLGKRGQLHEIGWDGPQREKLWRYNQHYFDDLNAAQAPDRVDWHKALLAEWVARNPPGQGTAWEPYPTSLRVVNWVKWALAGNVLTDACLHSLAVQVRWLGRRLEFHLLGNHLFSNAKALVFAGLFFDSPEADAWIHQGMTILARELPEQILDDGAQFERSTMYHALAFEDLLDLINVTRVYSDAIPERWRRLVEVLPEQAQRMSAWLECMCHPDGEIALFNDAAFGVAPAPVELRRHALAVAGIRPQSLATGDALRVVHLRPSGYIRADTSEAALIVDVAPIGPDYLPGHAHADTLSFELSIYKQRVIVNGGISQYGKGSARDAERGTPAHSTVTVNGENSSEVWAGFRVARRARPFDLSVTQDQETLRISCAHDGYKRLPGQPVHRRTWNLSSNCLQIKDHVEGAFESAVARFHLHPNVICTVDASGDSGQLGLSDGHEIRWRATGGAVQLEPSFYCPEFGRREPTQCISIALDGESAAITLEW